MSIGWTGFSMLSDLHVFDPYTFVWYQPEVSGPIPHYRAGHSTTLVGNKMFLLGGGDGDNYLNDLNIFDIKNMEWQQAYTAGISPSARSRHTSTLMGGNQLVIVGGGGDNCVFNDVYILNTDDMSWSRPSVQGIPSIPRWGHSSTPIGENKLLIFGGHDGSRMLNDCVIFNVSTLTWEEFPLNNNENIPSPRAGHTANYITIKNVDYILIFGGGDGQTIYNDLYLLNLEEFMWIRHDTLMNVPLPRCAHTSAIINNRLYIFGGGDGSNRFNDIHILDLKNVLKKTPNNNTHNISNWLRDIGMEQYFELFFNEHITMEILPYLTEDHLEKLNIPTLGARLLLLEEIKKLSNSNTNHLSQIEKLSVLENTVNNLVTAMENASNILTDIVTKTANSLK
eukprot:TRINITY_DN2146_c0_g1_i1.p1 TRINITY_DN2146_c0_g1~~TRINITY_DN2146_c0_g1_i1.p1  ORF type:complete len:395 (+),score=75.21 TRINITY_DN2146_c0_g1_i1:299-1483(+)